MPISLLKILGIPSDEDSVDGQFKDDEGYDHPRTELERRAKLKLNGQKK